MAARTAPIGFIADDITGATDLASALAGRGIDTRLVFGSAAMPADGGEAIVVALKIRSIPASEARDAALRAAHALRAAGVTQFFSKYCSTFDSTVDGNIGPIADALAELAGARRVLHCPAYPANMRTVYMSHLFVGAELLSESSMRNHPLNPMRDSQLVRVLASQTPHHVGAVPWTVVNAGPDALAAQLPRATGEEVEIQHLIADAVSETDLDTLAAAVASDYLAAGSAPFGAAFAVAALAREGAASPSASARERVPPGPTAILAGSLSRATAEQVKAFDGRAVVLHLDDVRDAAAVERALEAVVPALGQHPLLIAIEHNEDHEGPTGGSPELSARIEQTMGRLGAGLVKVGVRRLIVAGGETSGAVAAALDLRSARIGPDISVGVPWIVTEDLSIAFKSGNFGGPHFFQDALEVADS
ncbi:3-oxo-tetronate kinase [Microbacterium insulae]|uniref:3-oxo-tetronate kinase n=1 Tax=Microbacterium insulae TaxID=483014 RepID=A0ABW3AI00_9MICO